SRDGCGSRLSEEDPAHQPAQFRERLPEPTGRLRGSADRAGGLEGSHHWPGSDFLPARELDRQPGRRKGSRRGGADGARGVAGVFADRNRAQARSEEGGNLPVTGFSKEALKRGRVGVLMGGLSVEREVSLRSGAAVAKALRSLGYPIVEIDAQKD